MTQPDATINHAQAKVLFWLSDGRLIVANSGRAFTKHGLRSICLSSLSSKTEDGSVGDEPFSNLDDARERIESIRNENRSFATDYRDRAKSVREGVSQVARDYSGRILLELLQNAADANCTKAIGSKGLGFRAILNITDAPRIHSGHLNAEWSRKITDDFLEGAEKLPVLDIPAWSPLETEPKEVQELRRDYQTVIILPFDESGAAKLKAEWDEVSRDPSVLVFIEGLESVEWLREQLAQHLGDTWKISKTEEASEDGGRTDIIATSPVGIEHHIEVKRIKGRVIHWSAQQIRTAQATGRRYCIATVDPADGEAIVRWVSNPLSEFGDLKRRVRWTWKDESTDEVPDEHWYVRGQSPEKSADSYRVEIYLTDDFLTSLPQGIHKFEPA